MKFFFEIEDRLGHFQPIQDPVGWDDTTFILERDKGGKHGVFFQFQANPYTYDGIGFRILKTEYETYGLEGIMFLHIAFDCGTGVETLDRFRFDFGTYVDNIGDECSATISVESEDDAMVLRNRIDQKVNLQTLKAFDETTALPAYAGLPLTLQMPSKGIFVQDYATQTAGKIDQHQGNQQGAGYGDMFGTFSVPAYDKTVAAEIGGFSHPGSYDPYPWNSIGQDEWMPGGWTPSAAWVPLPWGNAAFGNTDMFFPVDLLAPIVNYDATLGGDFGTIFVDLTGRFKRTYYSYQSSGVTTSIIKRIAVYLGILKKDGDPAVAADWRWLSVGAPWDAYDGLGTADASNPTSRTVDFAFNFPGLQLNPGDRVYYFDKLIYKGKQAYSGSPRFDIVTEQDSYFKMSVVSKTAATPAKLFLVNEAASRIVEAITNDRIRLLSYFLGRTDSEPYAVPSDGCGGHAAVTTGLFIRQMEVAKPATPPIFALSFKDLWEGLNPIHNMGMGLEPDPLRPGFNRLRIEIWRHFYQTSIVHSCENITQIRRTIQTPDHYSVFKFGYAKWEAEQYNGIDEFLTNREYRTELTQAANTFTQISPFVASGFAIEVTRRLGNTTTEDWRYDTDTFIIQLKRSGAAGSALVVQSGDVGSPSNIIDPASVYNFRIRPNAMALAWLPVVLAGYKQAGFSSKIIFTNGTGNYYASGYTAVGNCVLEGHTISEKQDLSPNDLQTPAEGVPVVELERVVFQAPMTAPDFKKLRASPYGLVYYANDQTSGSGWLERLEYKINDGLANFTLIPAR